MAEHIVQPRTYSIIFVALIALTLTTVGLDFANLGHLHTFVALAIAVCKAVLIILFFMHVLYSNRLTWLVAGASLFWLGILLVLTLSDYLARGWLPFPGA